MAAQPSLGKLSLFRSCLVDLNEIHNSDGLNAIETTAANDYESFGMFLSEGENEKRVDLVKKMCPGL